MTVPDVLRSAVSRWTTSSSRGSPIRLAQLSTASAWGHRRLERRPHAIGEYARYWARALAEPAAYGVS